MVRPEAPVIVEVQGDSACVAAVLLIDPYCRVHLMRGFQEGNYRRGFDRPQLVAGFRN